MNKTYKLLIQISIYLFCFEIFSQQTSRQISDFIIKENTIYFKDKEAFDKTIEYLSNLNRGELDKWEKKNHFNSHRSKVNAFHDDLYRKLKTKNDFLTLVKNNSDLVYIDYSDSTLKSTIDDTNISSIANEEGIFYYGSTICMASKGKIYFSEKENKLALKKAVAENLKSTKGDIGLISYKSTINSMSEKSIQSNIGLCNPYEYKYDYKNEDDNKKLTLYAKIDKKSLGTDKFYFRIESYYKERSWYTSWIWVSVKLDQTLKIKSNWISKSNGDLFRLTNGNYYDNYYNVKFEDLIEKLENGDPKIIELDIAVTSNFGNISYACGLPKMNNWLCGNFNGDSKSDILRYIYLTSKNEVLISSGSFFASPSIWSEMSPIGADKLWYSGDFNGDGKDDILTTKAFVGVQVFTSNGIQFTGPTTWTGSGVAAEQKWTIGDFNGDGKDDILRTESGIGVQVCLSTGSAFSSPIKWTGSGFSAEGFWTVGDFNGDGKDDILRTESGIGVQVCLSTGSAFSSPIKWTGSGFSAEGFWTVGDFNGDGKDDILRTESGIGVQVCLSTGNAFSSPITWSPAGYGISGCWTVGDFNGDGKADILRTYNGTEVLLSSGNSFGNPIKWTNLIY